MEHSVIIGGKDLYETWSLIPTSRPVIKPPKLKSYVIDIPGADGQIDISDQPSGYPVFANRTGSLEFIVENQNIPWTYIHDEIINFIHARELKMELCDDRGWYYTGRFTFNEWKSNPDWSRVVIDYDVDPYKYSNAYSTTEDWEWDPFNFEHDVIYNATWNAFSVDGTDIEMPLFVNIDGQSIPIFRSRKPVIPRITVTLTSGNSMTMKFKNPELDIDVTKTLNTGNTTDNDIVMSAINPDNAMSIKFTGHGTVSIRFRPGRL